MPKVGIIIDKPSFSAAREGRLMTGFEENFLREKAARAGLTPQDYIVTDLAGYGVRMCPVTVTMGEKMLNEVTGKKSIWKWHLSPLDSTVQSKTVPTFDFSQMWKDWQLTLYFEMALKRAAQNATPGPWVRKEENYVLGPGPDEAIARLEALIARPPEWLSIDIETGRNQINTFGVAWSPSDAIAIKVLPEGMPAAAFHRLWDCIRRLCESEVPKIMQNGIYERTYLSRYGIRVSAFRHDTMAAMKFLWPELEKGLDNVGRIYTMEPYWKDDGRVASEEGKQKDWGDIRDWPRHFRYNCCDTSNTLIAALAQRADLANRGLLQLYDNYLVRLFDCVYEMGANGLPLSPEKQAKLIAEYEAKSAALVKQLSQEINPRSTKQKQKLLKDKGYVLPTKRATGKTTTDELALKRLRLKHPTDNDLKVLLEIAGIEKALSSYLRVRTLDDKRIRFMLDPHGTETGRMCLPGDAEVLTSSGWQRLDAWEPKTAIMQWEQTGEIKWCNFPEKHEFDFDGELVEAKTRRFSAVMTPEHRLPCFTSRGNFSIRIAADLFKNQLNIPLSGKQGTYQFISDIQTRILVMTQADGIFKRQYKHHRWSLVFGFVKLRKIARCQQLLAREGIKFSVRKLGKYTWIRIKVDDLPPWLSSFSEKRFGPWLLQHSASVFVNELVHWDSSFESQTVGAFEYSTCVRDNAEWAATMCHLAGYAARIVSRERKEHNWSTSYRVYIRKESITRVHPREVKAYPYTGKVYCPETDSGFFILRHNGLISITGNSCSNDPWGGGFNAQTMTDYVKSMIEWKPEEDRVFVEVDLKQAETKFVAYDACEETLLHMLETGQDVHRYVAAEIYKKPMAQITHDERQLGKKSGHGANYAMGVATFQDSCLKEMDLVLDRRMAQTTLDAYHRLFPKIRVWHGRIRETVYQKRRLSNPFGRVRYFYGRCDDNTYREAYAYRPQSTVPDLINHLMLALVDERRAGKFDFWLQLHVHDSILLSCKTGVAESIMRFALDTTKWHPEVTLPAGRLVIPVEPKFGKCLGEMQKFRG